MLELCASASVPLGEPAQLFDAAYEGYVVPLRLAEPTLRFMVEAFDYDLGASLGARADGEPVGPAMDEQMRELRQHELARRP